MNRFDFSGLYFHMHLPTFDTKFRASLAKRLAEYKGQVSLTPKAGNLFVIVSDNVIKSTCEKFDKPSETKDFYNKENSALGLNQSSATHNLLNSHQEVSNKQLYQKFMADRQTWQRSEYDEIQEKFMKILKLGIPIIKITDLYYVLDYYDSFTKFKWHSKKDDCRLLRAVVNGEGCFIVTSRK